MIVHAHLYGPCPLFLVLDILVVIDPGLLLLGQQFFLHIENKVPKFVIFISFSLEVLGPHSDSLPYVLCNACYDVSYPPILSPLPS